MAAERWADALEAAREAAVRASGGLLPGLESDWLDARRAELEERRLEALELIAGAGVALASAPELAEAREAAAAAVVAAPSASRRAQRSWPPCVPRATGRGPARVRGAARAAA
jgi:hypothetical protein